MQKNDVVAVIVTYNRKKLLIQCIDCVLKQKGASCDVIVIDNHSTDKTFDEVSWLIDNNSIRYEYTAENLGGAGGFQYGTKKALELGYSYIWLMDDDTMPSETALCELVRADILLGGAYSFLSSKVLWKDGTLCNMNIQRRGLQKRIKNFNSDLVKANIASFVSLFIKSSVVLEFGLPIKEFFIWSDDKEYTLRISKKQTGYIVTNSKVVHATTTNQGVNFSKEHDESRFPRYFYHYRNELYIYRHQGLQGWLLLCAKFGWWILCLLACPGVYKKKKIEIVFQGIKAGLRFNPQIEYASTYKVEVFK